MPAYTVTESTTAAADGTGTVRFRGPQPWNVYQVDTISLESDSTTLPEARLYRSSHPSNAHLLDTELDGSAGRFSRTGESDELSSVEQWCVHWSGASAGARLSATMSATVKPVRRL